MGSGGAPCLCRFIAMRGVAAVEQTLVRELKSRSAAAKGINEFFGVKP